MPPGVLEPGAFAEGFEPPEGISLDPLPEDAPPGERAGGGPGGFGRANVLVQRFHATPAFEARYQEQLRELRSELYGTDVARDTLAAWVGTLTEHAAGLVDATTVKSEAQAISRLFTTA